MRLNFWSIVSSRWFVCERVTLNKNQLFRKAAPRWLREPQDAFGLQDKTVKLECVADGFPIPVTNWFKIDAQSWCSA